MKQFEEIMIAYQSIKDRIPFEPEIGLVLGSGLGDFADSLEDTVCIPYSEIANFPVSTVVGHAGMFVFGKLKDKKVVCMKGRVHYYEGYSMSQVVMPIRLMKIMGISKLILTNAAGGINKSFKPGDLMMITDQITSFVPSPLIGPNVEEFGTRFPDMSHVYDENLMDILQKTAESLKLALKSGVYLQTTGPAYETPAEIRFFEAIGADAVGMSTTCEAMAARHMGLLVAGVSCITNMAAGVSKTPLNHKEVAETAAKVKEEFTNLIYNFISNI